MAGCAAIGGVGGVGLVVRVVGWLGGVGGLVPGWLSGWGVYRGIRGVDDGGVLGYSEGWVRVGRFGAVYARHVCIKMRYRSTPP